MQRSARTHKLRDGGLDLVMALVDPDALDGLEGVRLFDEELVLIAPPNHPLARAGRVPVDRLAVRPISPRHALPVSLVWRAGERPTPAAQAFRDHVLSTIRS
jgi:DNA-binding transcriptional LysR family regulator